MGSGLTPISHQTAANSHIEYSLGVRLSENPKSGLNYCHIVIMIECASDIFVKLCFIICTLCIE